MNGSLHKAKYLYLNRTDPVNFDCCMAAAVEQPVAQGVVGADPQAQGMRRPPNAYLLFCTEVREELMRKEPELSYRTVMARLGQIWNELSDAQKEPYKQRAKALQEQFKQENPIYKYKARKTKQKETPVQMTLPPGISMTEASYFMLVGVQTLMSGNSNSTKLTPPTGALAAKLAQLKNMLDAGMEEEERNKNGTKRKDPDLPLNAAHMPPVPGNGPFQIITMEVADSVDHEVKQGALPHMPPPPSPFTWKNEKKD